MKTWSAGVVVAAIFMIAIGVKGAYPSLERAQELFPVGQLLSGDRLYATAPYAMFNEDLSLWKDVEETQRALVEGYLISAITSTPVIVSTNVMDSGSDWRRLKSLEKQVRAMSNHLSVVTTNVAECEAIANYIGSLRTAAFPSDLVGQRGFVQRFTTNEAGQLVSAPTDNSAYNAQRELQLRVYKTNGSVCDYRWMLFHLCQQGVVSARDSLTQEAFISFTNRLVTISVANDVEQKELFMGLKIWPQVENDVPIDAGEL